MIRRLARASCPRAPLGWAPLGWALLGCALALGSVAAGAAVPRPAADERSARDGAVAGSDQQAIRSVITAQLDAFRHDDADGAYRIASPHIETRFGNAANFLAMVKTTYPAVYRAHDVNFGPIVRQDGAVVQQVGLVGPDGAREVALYSMEREANGSWRIDGCVLTADTSQET